MVAHNPLFRLDYLNRSGTMSGAVPLCSVEIRTLTRISWQGTDHARNNNFSLDNELRVSVPLTGIGKRNLRSGGLLSLFKRHSSCKTSGDSVKWDAIKGETTSLYNSGQESGVHCKNFKYWRKKLGLKATLLYLSQWIK
jgi:hypothetical protein